MREHSWPDDQLEGIKLFFLPDYIKVDFRV